MTEIYNATRAEYQIHLALAMRDVQTAVMTDRTALPWAVSHLNRARRLRLYNGVAMIPNVTETEQRVCRTTPKHPLDSCGAFCIYFDAEVGQ